MIRPRKSSYPDALASQPAASNAVNASRSIPRASSKENRSYAAASQRRNNRTRERQLRRSCQLGGLGQCSGTTPDRGTLTVAVVLPIMAL